MGSHLQTRRWHGGIGTGKSSALRQAVARAMDAGERPIAWLPAVSDIGLRTERIQFPDPELAARLGADGFAGQLARNLSSGERQRVRLAVALAASGGFAALDEPCRHLDPEHIQALNRILAERTASGMKLAACDVRRQLASELFADEVGEASAEPEPAAACGAAQGDPLALDIPLPFLLSSVTKPTRQQRIVIDRGSLIVVRGPNGSGKTSLLEVLSRAARAAGLHCGFSRQEPEHQVFSSTPAAELEEVASLHNAARWSGDDTASLLLRTWLQTPSPRLPLGVLCLLGAVIALRMGRDLVLLDEPTQGLDAPAARSLAGELVRCARGGARIVVATHDPELVRVANRSWSVAHGALMLGEGA